RLQCQKSRLELGLRVSFGLRGGNDLDCRRISRLREGFRRARGRKISSLFERPKQKLTAAAALGALWFSLAARLRGRRTRSPVIVLQFVLLSPQCTRACQRPACHIFASPISIPHEPMLSTLSEKGTGLPLSSHPSSTLALLVTWRCA